MSANDKLDYQKLKNLTYENGEVIRAASGEQLLALRMELDQCFRVLENLGDNTVANSMKGEIALFANVIDYQIKETARRNDG